MLGIMTVVPERVVVEVLVLAVSGIVVVDV